MALGSITAGGTLDVVETLSELVAIPSLNPMGRNVSGPEYFEYKVTAYLEELFGRLKLPWERQTVEPKRDNIFVRVDGDIPPDDGGQLLLFEVHQDTVPVDGMTIEPWTPEVREGRLYGRGACDIKGGMAAMLVTIARLAKEKPAGRPTVVLACTVNEEHGFTGASALSKMWAPGSKTIIPRRPDAAIVAEPTDLNVVTAHKGTLRWKCHARGRAVHSSQPQLGENAIYRMGRVLAALEAYQLEVTPQLPTHRLCGRPTLSVGTIAGGISVNTVPDQCTIEIDRRLVPGEDDRVALEQLLQFVNAYPGVEPGYIEHEAPFMRGGTLADDANKILADGLAQAAKEVNGQAEQIGVPYGTDASVIARAGVSAVVFGPGSIKQAHTADEWVPVDELQRAAETLYRFTSRHYSLT